jgi:hypothetical protein
MSTKNDYMLLFVGREWYNELPDTEVRKVADAAKAWFDNLVAQGKMKGANSLARSGTRVAANGKVISDGPYAETKEALGGYLILQAENLEEAIEIAKSFPSLKYGTTLEIRQINEECPMFRRVRELEQQLAAA